MILRPPRDAKSNYHITESTLKSMYYIASYTIICFTFQKSSLSTPFINVVRFQSNNYLPDPHLEVFIKFFCSGFKKGRKNFQNVYNLTPLIKTSGSAVFSLIKNVCPSKVLHVVSSGAWMQILIKGGISNQYEAKCGAWPWRPANPYQAKKRERGGLKGGPSRN